MKTKLIYLLTILLLLPFVNLKAQKMKTYEKEWAEVQKNESKGLPKSALKIVNEVYSDAKKNNNSEQVLKSFIYILKYKNVLEENAFERLCTELDSTAQKAEFPNNAVMHMMLADMYMWYYNANRWKFINRTNTVNFKNDDMQTWTLDFLVDKIIKQYEAALANPSGLQKIPVTNYKELIVKGTKPKKLRPTLYDFIANKAIDFFSNTEMSLTKPADSYELKDAFYFSDIAKFVAHNIESADSLSLHFHASCILQDLLKYKLKNKRQQESLIDADLKRIKFVYAHSVHPEKDKLYIEALDKLEKQYRNIPFSAEISYLRAQFYKSKASNYKPLDETTFKYKSYNAKALDICETIISDYPGENISDFAKKLKYQIKQKNLSTVVEDAIPVDAKFATSVTYRNTKKVYIKVAKIDRDTYKKIKESRLYGKDLYKKLHNKSSKVYALSTNLPGEVDYNSHTTEILLNKISTPGLYILFVADNEKFSYNKAQTTYNVFNVTNISYVKQQEENGSYKFLVLNRETGKPMSNVSCQTWYTEYNYKKRKYIKIFGKVYKTDENGSILIKPGENSSNSLYIDFSYENDFYSTSSIYLYDYRRKDRTVISTTFFTDRAIYRPGQTIYFKGITIEKRNKKNKILTNRNETVILYDVNSQKVASLNLKTNEYGTFSGTFNIPTGLINGNYRIQCSTGTKYISVEEYKRPKFEVKMLPFEGNYMLNDDVEVTGKAVTYSGAVLSDVDVKYRVIRTPKWRGWWYWYIPSAPIEIDNGTIKTDDSGEFKIKFKALPDLSMKKSEFLSFNYQIIADVTDINGETQSTESSLIVGYTALQINLGISSKINNEDEIYDNDKTKFVTINTQNLNYKHIPAQGEIKIYKLKDLPFALRSRLWSRPDVKLYSKEEWYKQFPGNIYDDEEDLKKLDKGKLAFQSKFDTKKNKKLDFSFVKKFETGHYIVEIESKDAFGNKVTNKQFFSVYSPSSKKMPYKNNFNFMAVDNSCEPGENAEFIIGTSLKNVTVLYEIEKKNKIISSKYLTLSNEQKTIKIPVKESDRGNFSVHFVFIKNNRLYSQNSTVYVPFSNKNLDIKFETFRDKLYPGQKEKWRIKIKGSKGEKVAAEMVATLYDASLDQFKANYWSFSVFDYYYSQRNWGSSAFSGSNSTLISEGLYEYIRTYSQYYSSFNWFGFSYYRGYRRVRNGHKYRKSDTMDRAESGGSIDDDMDVEEEATAPSAVSEKATSKTLDGLSGKQKQTETVVSDIVSEDKSKKDSDKIGAGVKVRTNFNETAFFYPHLMTNKDGDVIVEFTIPEALTKWKMMGFATTKDLKYGFINKELITQKDLMLLPNEPRFFRENDKITFPVKISNISDKDLNGKVKLELFDAITMQPVTNIFAKNEKATKDFSVKSKKNSLVSWNLEIPEGISAITYKVVASADDFSDGEQKPLPVLTNRMLVTESLPLPVRGNQTKTYKLEKLINSGKSTTLRNHKLTLEFTSNPAWYAVQALPYLMEYPYECTEQTFSRFYANSIASHVANSHPKIKRVFDSWKNTKDSKALLSNLEKNQELKSVLLEETPWVLDGKNESARKRRVGLLFDLNRMGNELGRALRKIQKAQSSNGGWPWFPGMRESRYITQHVVTGMGHLDRLGVKTVREDKKTWNMLKNAIAYLDIRIKEDYDWLLEHSTKKEMKLNHLSQIAIQYLYGRSYFKDLPIPKRSQEAFDYYKGQAEKYWLSQSKYMQGMIALGLHRYGNNKVPTDIINSLREKSIENEEMGMYWKDNVAGYYWYQAPIEQQALMIEAFDEVAGDQKSVESLKVWLLKQKQTQDWKTTKATTEAVYALLMRGTDLLASDKQVEIKMAGKIIDPKKLDDVKIEAGTGYFKTSWSGNEIKPEMGNITVSKKDKGVAWGALYWQYFEQLDKITPHETPLKLKKQLFIEKVTDRGKVIEPIAKKDIKIGDKIIVRIELRVDRRMEYIHMKDMRASGFEPINVISRYKWQDNLGYYESTKDASTNFFMDRLPKGTYVFEYPLRVTHKGDFSNGITTIQCMYAPEFTSHSEGIRVHVKK